MLFCGFFFNLPLKTTQFGVEGIDWWSNDIMVADLSYRQFYGSENLFLNAVTPISTLSKGTISEKENQALNKYIEEDVFLKEEYIEYRSNIVIHRFLYAFIDRISPFPNRITYICLEILSALMSALIISYVLKWIAETTNLICGYILLVLLALFAPNLMMAGKNLYWAIWNLYIPMAGSIAVVHSNQYVRNDKKILIVGFIAFLTCSIKILCYIEYVSVAMIAMLIPYIYDMLITKYRVCESIKVIISASVGALLSFFMVAGFILLLNTKELGSLGQAAEFFNERIMLRTAGINADGTLYTTGSIYDVGKLVAFKPAYTAFTWVSYTQFEVILMTLVGSVVVLLFKLFIKSFNTRHLVAFFSIVWLSFLAPLSWFVLAKAHVLAHPQQSGVLWFVPFSILAAASIVYVSTDLIKQTYGLLVSYKQ